MLGIVLDGAGHPRALVVTTEARVVPFDQVDADHARDEGEGDGSLEHWREVHERFFTEHADGGFQPDMLGGPRALPRALPDDLTAPTTSDRAAPTPIPTPVPCRVETHVTAHLRFSRRSGGSRSA